MRPSTAHAATTPAAHFTRIILWPQKAQKTQKCSFDHLSFAPVYFFLPLDASDDPTFALVFHVRRRRLRCIPSEVSLDDAQREIDPRRQSTGRRDRLVLFDETQPAFDLDFGKRLRESIEKVVMRRGRLAIEQTSPAELERAGAD